jgi:hypothetical protein
LGLLRTLSGAFSSSQTNFQNTLRRFRQKVTSFLSVQALDCLLLASYVVLISFWSIVCSPFSERKYSTVADLGIKQESAALGAGYARVKMVARLRALVMRAHSIF